MIGLRDTWTALQFDDLVISFGERVDAKCSEIDEQGNPVHNLSEYVYDKRDAGTSGFDADLERVIAMNFEEYRSIPGVGIRFIDNSPKVPIEN